MSHKFYFPADAHVVNRRLILDELDWNLLLIPHMCVSGGVLFIDSPHVGVPAVRRMTGRVPNLCHAGPTLSFSVPGWWHNNHLAPDFLSPGGAARLECWHPAGKQTNTHTLGPAGTTADAFTHTHTHTQKVKVVIIRWVEEGGPWRNS